MIGLSWMASRYVKKSREAYNGKEYKKSRKFARNAHFLSRNRNSFDMLARSNLRLRRFNDAKKYYRKSEQSGYKLLDHDENRFKAEIGSLSYLGAYQVVLRCEKSSSRTVKIKTIIKELKKLSDKEITIEIEKLSVMGKLPKEITRLLPMAHTSSEPYSIKINDNSLKRLSPEDIEIDRYRREISRITSSGTYKIMNHISSSLHSPLKILYLPISLSFLSLKLLKDRAGGLSSKRTIVYNNDKKYSGRNCAVLFPTNGVGFGHFTRMLALAKSMRKQSPDIEIVFFTTMPTLHLLSEENFVAYHLPGRYRYRDMDPKVWNTLCEEILNIVFLQHRPSYFVFDGAYPYRGMLNAISNLDASIKKVWLKRPSIKSNAKSLPVDCYNYFNAIVKPGDSTNTNFDEEYDNDLNLHEVSPMLIYDQSNIDYSQSIRKRLDIPEDSLVAYVQLGAGKINDIEDILEIVLSSLAKYSECYVIMAESLIGDRLNIEQDRLRILRDFPNSRWFHDVDFSIIAGGYNSYHEMVEFCVPSIVIPNTATGRDDQVARIKEASEKRAMVMLTNPNKISLEVAIERIMESDVRMEMSANLEDLRKPNGSDAAATWILQP